MKKFKKILALALCLLMVLGAAVACDSSDETDESATEAATTAAKESETEAETEPEDDKKDDDKENEDDEPASDAVGIASLAEITEMRGNYYLTADIGTADALNATSVETFKGTLDGKNFKIYTSVPLFKELGEGATIKNLTVEGAVALKDKIGGVIAPNAADHVTLEKVTNNASLTLEQTDKSYVGGLIGWAQIGATMKDCVNNGAVTVKPAADDTAGTGKEIRVGGFVGCVAGNVATSFTNCTNNAKVTVVSTHGTCLGGGFIGDLSVVDTTVVFENCTNNGAVSTASLGAGSKLAGFVGVPQGYTNATYRYVNCKNTGSVSAARFAAGIAGDIRTTSEFINCVNTGNISILESTLDTDIGAAGIFGQVYQFASNPITVDVKACANYGKISVATSKNAHLYAAGIGAEANGMTVSVVDCANYGEIESAACAGGIFGRVNVPVSTFTRCLNVGSVTGTKTSGAIIANMTKSNNDTTKFITLTDCYSVDTVTYGVATTAADDAANGNVKYIYGGEEKGTVIGGTDTVGGATAAYSALFTLNGAKSADALKGDTAKTTLAGFDFTNTWKATAGGYPELA